MTWYTKYLSVFEKPFSSVPSEIIEEMKEKLRGLNNEQPLASVVVIAHNEETRLLSCLWSLSDMVCRYPVEIIGVNNNSSDKTEEVFKAVGITPYFEEKKSCGYARQRGLYNARGKYYICIDSDTMYPPYYVETMVTELEKLGVAGASGLLSLLPDKQHSRLGLAVYEFFRDIHIRTLFVKRPELGARGAAYAYRIEYGRKVGYRVDLIRGEDGSMILGLKNYGKIKLVTSRKARPVTPVNFSETDGSLFKRFLRLSVRSLQKFPTYFTKKEHYQDDPSNIIDG
jgi:glycosyltransferase involved in cell wall biosynthesis